MFLRTVLCCILMLWMVADTTPVAYAGIGEVGGIGQAGSLSPEKPSDDMQEEDSEDSDAANTESPADKTGNNQEKPAAKKDSTGSGPQASSQQRGMPLLTISFRQKRAYYEKSLKQVIKASERNKGVTYQLVSLIPSSSARSKKGAQLTVWFNKNLGSVVNEIKALGVPANRIRTSTSYYEGISTQEVVIYAIQPQ